MNTANFQGPTITIRNPCTCGAKRWFSCRCSSEGEQTFHFPTGSGVDGLLVPTAAQVASVRADFPEMDLIYID